MKKAILFSISLLFVGCSQYNTTNTMQVNNDRTLLSKNDTGNPPNPEALNINHCFRKKTSEEQQKCFKLYDKDTRTPIVVKVYLASSRAGNDVMKLKLEGSSRLLINADKTNVQEPISIDVPNTIIYRDSSDTITFDINVKDIKKNRVIIYDGDHNPLVEYKIIN